ncbi:MAG TPA: protein-L-isoaspartate(D-aspartate) O-methyltransferase [Roseiarcus sp.]|jgi:protein-L-isoaspartate(D-aspartate) O-methyltransferase|nr:protein-L-isoaspartate(D-aspartate) O-methyltransferase [Roseiarcus sp.]
MTVAESEERAQFTLAMRARGINDLELLRALERAPRALFMPPRFADIAGRDIGLPIGCGQTSPPPSIVAAMIAALALKPAYRVCEIGTGTGYCAALLAQLANSIVSLERFQTLAVEASARIKAFGLANVTVDWADGFERHLKGERFDRVLVHALMEPPGEAFRRLIRSGGILVAVVAGPDRGEQRIVRLTDTAAGAVEAEDMGPARGMRPLEHGLARAL